MFHGDGRKGWPDMAPFDYIHSGACKIILLTILAFFFNKVEILDQVKKGGRLVTPISAEKDNEDQYIWVIDKDTSGEVTRKKTIAEVYVNLQSAEKQVKMGAANAEKRGKQK